MAFDNDEAILDACADEALKLQSDRNWKGPKRTALQPAVFEMARCLRQIVGRFDAASAHALELPE